MKTLLFFFSDIHLTGKRPENEGIVINAFCDDVARQLSSIPHSESFALVGGDLVQAADETSAYQAFYDRIISKLVGLGIPKDNFFTVPGNHDCQRQWVIDNREIYAPIINQVFTEDRFNDLINGIQQGLFLDKFHNYVEFVTKYLPNPKFSPFGYSVEINDEWSLYCLNSALTSFAGYEWELYPQLKNDEHRLNIDTRGLYEWILRNSKRKILMMHHPVAFLSDWADVELTKIIKKDFDLILTGHTHRQNLLCNQTKGENYIWCKAPQLYTDKTDKLGYCVIELEDDNVNRIIYREWFDSRLCFKKGMDFTDDDEGIVVIERGRQYEKDRIRLILEERFRDTMAVYGEKPLLWVDRYFSYKRFDRVFSFQKQDLHTEDDIIENGKSVKIITPSQYGLSSFGWHFLLKLWTERKVFGLFLDCNILKAKKIENFIDNQLSEYGMSKDRIGWFVFDNWNLNNKDAKQILAFMRENYADIPMLLLCPLLERSFTENENISSHDYSIESMYMAPMQMSQLRSMVTVYNKSRNIGEEDVVLKRLNDDIQNFNMHRTPLNCISLLEVFSNSFDENPVNRTEMINKLLGIIFDNEEVPNYKSLPDVKDCEFAIGFFCELMIRQENYYFSSADFYEQISVFCKKQKITLDVNYLFDILLKNQIICQYDRDLYGFRFAFWVYYFAAMRMTKSKDFAAFILENENYAHYPEILEFYTGSDRTKDDAADVVTCDLEKITNAVHDKVGLPEKLNPFQLLKLEISDQQAAKAIEKLDEELKQTKLPTGIKDAIDDNGYNPASPYHQDVRKVWENYSVNYLQEIIAIASKTLRNSDYIEPGKKTRLLDAITDAWLNTLRVVYLLTPFLALEGRAGYDDFNLQLCDGFDKFKDDKNRLLIEIISAIPLNIVTWYKDNLYSAKLADLFYDKIHREGNLAIKHVMVKFIIYEQPTGWDEVVRKYLETIGKSSFYLGDIISSLKEMYSMGVMSEADVAKTKQMILLAYTKIASKDGRLNPGLIKHINKDVLPSRKASDEE